MNKDQSLDTLLSHSARPNDERHASGACLDAETLAAWTDGTLTAAARAVAEAHAADCDRCLAVLGALARTAPPPSVDHARRWFSVRWLVPLATASVAVLAWVVVGQLSNPPAKVIVTEKDAPVAQATADALHPGSPAKQDAGAAPQAAVDALQDKALSRDKPEPRLKAQLRTRSANESLRKDSALPPAAAAAPATAPARSAAEASAPFAERREAQKPAAIIASPQSSIAWRIDGQTVNRSTDGGATWQTQATGTTVDLLAGSASSPTVCWIVGRKGTVLLTTDGATWRRLPFPQPDSDLVAVAATDQMTATVTTATGAVFRTVDAGRTWTLQ
jgi:uncharacterized protein (DUF4415 family)